MSVVTPYSEAYAASVAPAKIVSCAKVPDSVVRELLAQALNASLGVQSRILRFEQRASDVERAELWNGGPEWVWLSDFDTVKYRSLCNTFRSIGSILGSKRLDVICAENTSYSWALPGIWKIHLGRNWIDETDREWRAATIVHEAAHIAGRVVVLEKPWYNKAEALDMAHKKRRLRPRMAMRSAENIGWYALDLHENFLEFL